MCSLCQVPGLAARLPARPHVPFCARCLALQPDCLPALMSLSVPGAWPCSPTACPPSCPSLCQVPGLAARLPARPHVPLCARCLALQPDCLPALMSLSVPGAWPCSPTACPPSCPSLCQVPGFAARLPARPHVPLCARCLALQPDCLPALMSLSVPGAWPCSPTACPPSCPFLCQVPGLAARLPARPHVPFCARCLALQPDCLPALMSLSVPGAWPCSPTACPPSCRLPSATQTSSSSSKRARRCVLGSPPTLATATWCRRSKLARKTQRGSALLCRRKSV